MDQTWMKHLSMDQVAFCEVVFWTGWIEPILVETSTVLSNAECSECSASFHVLNVLDKQVN